MVVIGIVGGIASGKSLVSEQLRELGAEVISADRIGHEVLLEAEVQAALRARWGEAVFDSHGRPDRAAIARRVFDPVHGPEERRFLESLSHPRIRARMQAQLQDFRSRQVPAVVLDAALLFEAGWNALCDHVLFVDTPAEQRRERAAKRGWTANELATRESAQLPLEEKRRRCTSAIDNSRTVGHTWAQIQLFWQTVGCPSPLPARPN